MSTLKIITTYQCTAQCDHCRFGCRTLPAPFIDEEMTLACIGTLLAENSLDYVVFLGGEPLVAPERLFRLVQATSAMGLGTRVETNGFWATDEHRATTLLAPYAALGTHLMLSLDAFHAPYVPVERVAIAMRAADALQMGWSVETAFESKARNSARDQETLALIAQAEKMLGKGIPQHFTGTVFCIGRAARTLAPALAPGRGIPQERCTAVPWWYPAEIADGKLWYLDADGYLSKGCGIVIGNIRHESTHDLMARFDAHAHPIFQILLEQGPRGLADLAIQHGYHLKSDYADRCQLCHEARAVLQGVYPEFLVDGER
ncbi:MAG: radical SAM protein [bacterium]